MEIPYAVTPGHQQSAGCHDLPGHPVQNTHQPPCPRSTSSFTALSVSNVVFWFACLSPSAGSGSVGSLPVLALGAPPSRADTGLASAGRGYRPPTEPPGEREAPTAGGQESLLLWASVCVLPSPLPSPGLTTYTRPVPPRRHRGYPGRERMNSTMHL